VLPVPPFNAIEFVAYEQLEKKLPDTTQRQAGGVSHWWVLYALYKIRLQMSDVLGELILSSGGE
jgi:hypothetical protein